MRLYGFALPYGSIALSPQFASWRMLIWYWRYAIEHEMILLSGLCHAYNLVESFHHFRTVVLRFGHIMYNIRAVSCYMEADRSEKGVRWCPVRSECA